MGLHFVLLSLSFFLGRGPLSLETICQTGFCVVRFMRIRVSVESPSLEDNGAHGSKAVTVSIIVETEERKSPNFSSQTLFDKLMDIYIYGRTTQVTFFLVKRVDNI